MRIYQKVIVIFCALTFLTPTLWAQRPSAISRALQLQNSIVKIKALHLNKDSSSPVNQGAGMILSEDGYIVTNLHIIFDANKIIVILEDNKKYSASVDQILPEHDLALLKIKPTSPLEKVPLANSNNVRLGDDIIHIGNSYLLDKTITGGKITGLGRRDKSGNEIELIQTNLNLYKGDSGEPIFTPDGKLLGMIIAKNFKMNRKSFAIPSNKIIQLIKKR